MININLLPYRAEQQKSGQVRFGFHVVIVVLVAALVLAALHWHFNSKISEQRDKNQKLEQAIFSLTLKNKAMKDLKVKTADLIQRLQVIESLQARRHQVVDVLAHWPGQLPDGIYLLQFQREGHVLTLDGLAENHQQVSGLMRRMEALPSYQNIRLKQVETKKGKQQSGLEHFSIQADLVLSPRVERRKS